MKLTSNILPGLLAAFILLACQPEQVTDQPQGLEQLVDELCKPPQKGLAPGTAIAVVKGGEVLINKGYGYANLDYEIPITPESRFDLASVSKQFAGYAISKLIEEGKIAISDDIREYIPELPAFDEGPITIDHLVHHTSGIRDWASTTPLTGRTFDDVISYEHILRMAYNQRALNFPPGDQYSYTNTGYNLLAELVQRVSGQTFREWTDENIFRPLGMKSTLFFDNHKETIPKRVSGYLENDGAFEVSPNLLTALGSSSMYSTSTDLVKWANFLQEGMEEGDPIVRRMLTQGILNNGEEITYAYGLGVSEFNGTRWISHSGSWASFRTYIALLPEHDLSVIVLSNYSKHGANIAREIAARFVPGLPGEEAEATEADRVEVATDVMQRYVGTYKLGDAWYVQITMKEDQLWTQATNESNFPMVPLSDSIYRIPAYGNRTMSFHQGATGTVTHLVYMEEERAKLASSFEYRPAIAAQYEGRYYSEELNTPITVRLEGDELKIWHFDHGSIDLIPAWTDDFRGEYWWIQSVVFERDDEGSITGFRASSGRSRNQWFAKVE